ncbi:MAG: bifunctional phosphoribosylaminoimidazolecarboxamide formyltransferase/IMP cyclohydrolase [bacterium]
MSDNVKIKRAIISVSDKSGVGKLAKALQEMGVEILSTGGTLKKLRDADVQAVSVSTFTGAPEIMGGRVKTLHPKIYAGLLCRRDNPDDIQLMSESDYKAIDLVVVNLYPFKRTVARPDSDEKEIIENIDIGGPSMIRASAKNFDSVVVLTDPEDYDNLLQQMQAHEGGTTFEFRRQCAAKAFAMTADYDTAIAGYFAKGKEEEGAKFPQRLSLDYSFRSKLRYGENPHQQAAVYADENFSAATLMRAQVLSGKELSYNNYGDLDATLEMLLDFEEPFACVVKHANPCGAATGTTIAAAYQAAYESDPLSAFGSIIGLNKPIDMKCAELLHETPFVECILAPGIDPEALKMLQKKKARRILVLPQIEKGRLKNQMVYKIIRGGLLTQSADDLVTLESSLKVVSERPPTSEELKSLLFGWRVVKHVKSNAILLSKGNATVGIGMGQTSRVDSTRIAVWRAGARTQGAVMASDAFFPMPDGAEVALEAGVTAVIQPGGSKGDEAVIEAVNKAGAAMVFTGNRHFKH